MKRKLKDCGVFIVNEKYLMTGDGIYVETDIYKENCEKDCKLKHVCGVVLNKLDSGDYKGAATYLQKHK